MDGDGAVIGRQSEQVDRDDAARLEPIAFGRRDGAREAGHVDIEGLGVDIDEDRRRAEQRHDFGGGAEGEGRTKHGIAGADTLRHQHQQQRVGAAGATHRMAGPGERRKVGFELPHFRAHDELAVIEHARDRRVDCGTEPAALRGDVDERDRRGIEASGWFIVQPIRGNKEAS